MYARAVAAPTHPVLSPAEYAAAMGRAGWRAPMELIGGEVVVIPPSGGDTSLAQTELVHRLRAWQLEGGVGGRLPAHYLDAGVRELWLVDPAERTVTVLGAAPGRRLSGEDVATSALLPGLALPVRELFAR
jgi:Uma2 family endonuclease